MVGIDTENSFGSVLGKAVNLDQKDSATEHGKNKCEIVCSI